MCGRARCALHPHLVAALFGKEESDCQDTGKHHKPLYNAHPGNFLPVVYCDGDANIRVRMMRWGMVPGFSKAEADTTPWRIFNARSDRLSSSPVHRRLLDRKRCVVPLEGFFEWRQEKGVKQPYFVYEPAGDTAAPSTAAAAGAADARAASAGAGAGVPPADGGPPGTTPLLVAGLYDVWKGPDGDLLYSFALITTDSSKTLSWLHDRMPVVLSKEQADLWLSGGAFKDMGSRPEARELFAPRPNPALRWHAVDRKMSKMAYNEPDVSAPKKEGKNAITNFFKRSPVKPKKRQPSPPPSPRPVAVVPKPEPTAKAVPPSGPASEPASTEAAAPTAPPAPLALPPPAAADTGAGAGAGAGAHADASEAPSTDVAGERPMCRYGADCYRTNPVHLAEFSHPSGPRPGPDGKRRRQ